MVKGHYFLKVCSGISIVFFILFLVAGIILPGIINNTIYTQAANNAMMQQSNYDTWGQIPGKLGAFVQRLYYFYNFTNPFDALFYGATPKFVQTPSICYQELQNFSDVNYTQNSAGQDYLATFHFQLWNQLCENSTDEVNITTINMGPMGAWYQFKTASKPLVALNGLANLILGLESQLDETVIGTMALLFADSPTLVKEVLIPANITDNATQYSLVNDTNYGILPNKAIWVQVFIELNQSNSSPTAYFLMDYFKVSYNQITSIVFSSTLGGQIQSIIAANVDCEDNNLPKNCTPLDFAASQWGTSSITSASGQASVTGVNTTIQGYPEINNYVSYMISQKVFPSNFTNIVFNLNLSTSLLNHSTIPGEYIESSATLLNIANMENFFSVGEEFDQEGNNNYSYFASITQQFNLPADNYTYVLWNYLKYIGSEFALKSQSLNGTSSIAGMGAFGSQAIYETFVAMEEYLLPTLVSMIIDELLPEDVDCFDMMETSIPNLSPFQYFNICTQAQMNPFNYSSVQFLMNMCLYPYGNEWTNFTSWSGLNSTTLFGFCQNNNNQAFAFGSLYSYTNAYLNKLYGCSGNTYCSKFELALKQWGSSNITLNPPEILSQYFESSYSVSDWNPQLFPNPVEYMPVLFQFYQDFNTSNVQGLNITQTMALNNFNSLWNTQMVQFAFLLLKNNLTANITTQFGLPAKNLQAYLRYMIIYNAMGGFTQVRTVNELLWGYTDPLLVKLSQNNPLTGGDPSVNTVVALGGQNSSYEDGQNYKMSMYTGADDISKVRQYEEVFGYPYITFNSPYFNGTNVVEPNYISPWLTNTTLSGTDCFLNKPNMSPDENITLYVYDIYFSAQGYNTGDEEDYSGLSARRYKLSDYSIANKTVNPNNSNFYSNKWNGVINVTTSEKAPVFITKAHFLDADSAIQNAVQLYYDSNMTQLIVPNSVSDDIFADVEPISGVALGAMQRLQTVYELQQDDLFNTSNYAMLPIYWISRGTNFTSDMIENTFGELKTGLTIHKWIDIICYSLSGIFLLLSIFLIYRLVKLSKDENGGDFKERFADSQQQYTTGYRGD